MNGIKKIVSIAFALCVMFSFVACGKPSEGNHTPEVEVPAEYTRLDIKTASGYTVGGYGAQIDTDQFMPFNQLTEQERTMLKQRIKDMNLQYTRIKMFGEYFEMANDNDDPNVFDYNASGVFFDSTEMKALYEVLDLCEENGIRVDLSWYNCNATFRAYDQKDADGKLYEGTWMGYTWEEAKTWCTAPRTDTIDGYAEQAENISVCLDYLLNTKGYTCIYGFSFIAEGFYSPSGIDWDEYVKCCEVINNRLIKDGLRDKLLFIGTSNEAKNLGRFEELQKPLKDIFDVGGFGNYHWDITSNPYAPGDHWSQLREVCDNLGYTDFICAEWCTSNSHALDATTWDDVDTYESALYHATFMIDAAKYGFTTLNHYIVGDTFFTNSYVHKMGLWLYRDGGWKAHPKYYVWGMVCKYTDIGAEVYNIDYDTEGDVMAVAFKLPDGSWSYMLVNKGETGKKVAVVNTNADRAGKMQCYKVTESSVPEDRACVLPESYKEEDASDGVVYLTLPAMSFTVVSDR